MNRLFLILFLFFILPEVHSQVTGFAFLSGQTTHAGVKVKFIAGSGGAVTDSVFTNANGSYSIVISGGIYTLVFSKSGYQTRYYNNNSGTVLSNTTIIPAQSLTAGNSLAVTGAVSGIWMSNTLYVVNGPITVPTGSVLIINPGTEIKFNGNFNFDVFGVLTAIGNSNSKIHFNSFKDTTKPGDWGGINLHNNSSSSIQNCIIENCLTGIGIKDCSPVILHNEIRSVSAFGIYLKNSSSLIKQNIIHNYGQGIANESSQGFPTVECNEIFDGGIGIRFQNNGLILNNVVYQNSVSGIDCNARNKCRIENNYIHHCFNGILIGENVMPVPSPTIINNTILGNTNGIYLTYFYASGTIANNLISGNVIGINGSQKTPDNVSYNLMWNNSSANFQDVQIIGLGQNVNTNSNGDPVDTYYNMVKNPLFVNSVPPVYSAASPCKNAGNPVYSSNIGFDATSACAGMVLGVQEIGREKIDVFPNPFSDHIIVSEPQNSKIQIAAFYDISGKRYEAQVESEIGSSTRVSKAELSPGLYILVIQFSDSSSEYIRLIKE